MFIERGEAHGRAEVAGASPEPPTDVSAVQRCGRRVRGVVVGVDGSLGVLTAVSWAAAEAADRGVDLHLLHVGQPGHERSAEARGWLHRALGAAAAVAPGVRVTVIRESGSVAATLARYSERACLLVVGGRRPLDGGPSAGRTVAHVLGRAGCPVVLVPPRRTGAWASTRSRRAILAVTAADDGCALDLAEQTGVRCGAPVVVLADRRRTPPGSGTLAPGRDAGHATVHDLAAALRDLGPRAQLIVMGLPRELTSTGSQAATGVVDLLVHSPCPVMVSPVQERSNGDRKRSVTSVSVPAAPTVPRGSERASRRPGAAAHPAVRRSRR